MQAAIPTSWSSTRDGAPDAVRRDPALGGVDYNLLGGETGFGAATTVMVRVPLVILEAGSWGSRDTAAS